MSNGSREVRPRRFAWMARTVAQTPAPLHHAKPMLGLGVVAGVVVLIAGLVSFGGHTDIDAQPPRHADYRVDINSQRWAELANLPRIGEKTAKRIVAYGESVGGFQSAQQLMDVKGVGQKTLDGMRSYLTNGEP